MIAGLIPLPVGELPRVTVCPPPTTLLPLVSPSNPKRGAALFAQLTQDELICSIGGYRGQMSASTPAVLFGTGPVWWHQAQMEWLDMQWQVSFLVQPEAVCRYWSIVYTLRSIFLGSRNMSANPLPAVTIVPEQGIKSFKISVHSIRRWHFL